MAKKQSDGFRKQYRIWQILNRLQNGEVRLKTLAEEFKVTKKSIERDMDRIELSGWAVVITKPGWRAFAPGVGLKRAELSTEQQATLAVLNEVSRNLGKPMYDSFQTIFKHLMECDPWESDIIPVMPKLINKKDIPHAAQIISAIEDRRQLKIKYRYETKKTELKIIIHPVKILISEGFPYVLTAPQKDGAWKKYRIDRILSLEELPEKFPAPEGLDKALKQARSIYGIMPEKDRKIQVRLSVDILARDYFRHQELVGGQKIKLMPDGSLTYEAKVGNLMEIIPHILRWIPHVTVVEPQDLKDRIRASVNAYLKR
jgi:predicted DNA-binding transcriptional regulator YafY